MNNSSVPEPTVWGYVRGSTDKQENTPEVQTGILQEWADKKGVTLTLVYEATVSAMKQDFKDRPAGREVLAKARSGDTIVAVRLDRLFRRGSEIGLCRKLAKQNISLVTVDDPLPDPTTVIGRYVQGIFILNGELEVGIIGARIRENMAYRTKTGLPNNGFGKFGHKLVKRGYHDSIFVPDEAEMMLIREASHLRVCGYTLHQIARRFAVHGHLTARIDKRTGERVPWSFQRVQRVTLWWWKQIEVEQGKLKLPKQIRLKQRKKPRELQPIRRKQSEIDAEGLTWKDAGWVTDEGD